MRRITVAEVVDAYINTGLVPCRYNIFSVDRGFPMACAIGALIIHNVSAITSQLELDMDERNKFTDQFDSGYIREFMTGFDSNYLIEQESVGFNDGMAARKAVGL